MLLTTNFSALTSQFLHRPGDPTCQADYLTRFGGRSSRILALSRPPDLVSPPHDAHGPSLPRLDRPVPAQDGRFLGFVTRPDLPARYPRASTASRGQSASPQPAALAAPSHALGRRPPCGQCGFSSVTFDSHRFLVGGSALYRCSIEQLGGSGGSGGSSGASRGGASGAAATSSGCATRRDAAQCGRRTGCRWA